MPPTQLQAAIEYLDSMGWQVVPKMPTQEMLKAAGGHPMLALTVASYLDLLAAAQEELAKLREAIERTLNENGHLADGDDCTLIHLVRAIDAARKVAIRAALRAEWEKLRSAT